MGQSETPPGQSIEALRAIPRASVRELNDLVERTHAMLRSGELDAALSELSRAELVALLGELDAAGDRAFDGAGPARALGWAALLGAAVTGACARVAPVAWWVAAGALAAIGLAWEAWSARRASRLADRVDRLVRRLEEPAARPSAMTPSMRPPPLDRGKLEVPVPIRASERPRRFDLTAIDDTRSEVRPKDGS